MARNVSIYLLSIAALLLGGCTGDVADKGWQARRPLGKDLATYRPPVAPGATSQPTGPQEPEGPLTLRDALTLAMLHSPDLAAVAWDVRMAEARAIQAGLPPNPEIGFDLETYGALSAAETTLQLGQVIFLSDKLWRQRQAALLERDLAGWDYEAKRLAVLTDATTAFVALVTAQERVTLAEELLAVSRKVLDAAAERAKSGKTSPVEEMKARVELGSVRMQLEAARQEVQGGRARLAATWGATRAKFAKAQAALDAPATIPSAEQLAGLLVQNPDVARWATEMQRRLAAAKLENAKAIPDLTIGAGAKRDGRGGPRGWTAGASIGLPIFDRNQGGIAEARYNLSKALADKQASEARVHAELADAYQALATAHAQSIILKADVLPEAQKAFDASTEGYRQGKFAYLDVLDAQRTLFDARSQHLTALAEYHVAAALVEGLVGQSIEAIAGTKASTQEATTQKSQEK